MTKQLTPKQSDLGRVISHDCKAQAETLFKVLVKKGFTVVEIADILGHCGKMFVEYAKDLTATRQ